MPSLFELADRNLVGLTERQQARVEEAGMTIDEMARENRGPVPFMVKKLAQDDYGFINEHSVYFIHLGKPGSEKVLIAALNQTGDLVESPVLVFLESSHRPLVEAARAWASRHGYNITGQPAGFLSWGDWGVYD